MTTVQGNEIDRQNKL